MSTIYFRGDANSTNAQTTTLTVGGAPGVGDVLNITINRKVVSYTAIVGDTTSSIASALWSLLIANTNPEFQEVTWSVSGAVLTGVSGSIPETPFTVTTSVTLGAGTSTLTAATVSGSDQHGPSHLDDATNYSTGVLPVSTDTLVFPDQNPAPACKYGLTALSAVSLTELQILSGTIGLPDKNANGYTEYRTKDLALGGCSTLTIRGTNITLARVNLTAGTCNAKIDAGGGFAFAGTSDPSIRLIGAGTFATVAAIGGDIGLAYFIGEAVTVTTLTVGVIPLQGSVASSDPTGRVRIGSGATVTNAILYGGQVETLASGTNLTIAGGVWRQIAGNLGTVTSTGGTVDYRSTGSIGNATFSGEDAVFDLSGGTGAVTIGTLSVKGGARIIDPHKRISALSYTTDRESLAVSEIGESFTLTRS